MPTKILIDCDPGHDDALALMLAHGSPEVELVGITTVAGNQTLDKVTRNALAVATVAGIQGVPVAAGCARPLVRPVMTAPEIHGESGLDGPELPEPTVALDARHAVDLIIETVMSHAPGEITLVPLGALTNIALAVRREPRIVERVKEVVLMGGGYHHGNRTAVAEFNIAVDPEAAHIVFGEAWPVTMVGLDLTYQATATPEVMARIAALGTPAARFVVDSMEHYGRAYHDRQDFPSPPVHDPCAVARVIDPRLVSVRRAPISVELAGTHTTGMTVADLRRPAPAGCTTQVAVDLDHAGFWDVVVDALERIG
ncbi:nucleoside hydrolase [Clavibacter sp. VKM Ac-2872]|uniref:uridine-preferring nucleoside hydrolase UriH n=1 Tax=Clavibacter sp. VKM Ac-2872 TaxID=2783812 RepID=UPI00188A3C8F|nr:nucleoside hydrolase [Clavibacter sp. VKM Ac-2872]MBF4623567.1 nucleoside hydrolase [Clavibacter sp. VKM Ac-2872]